MSFRPAHPQPFTVAEAEKLDVGTIVAEIARLRNSLTHLDSSQTELCAFLKEDEDADLRAAWLENEGTIASQRERVELLRHVLSNKVGEESLEHYGVGRPALPAPSSDTAIPFTPPHTGVPPQARSHLAGAGHSAPAEGGPLQRQQEEGMHL